jgi:hypothetical protein
MSDRKLVTIIVGVVVLVGGLLWTLALTYRLPAARTSQTSSSTPSVGTPEPSPTAVSNPAESLQRAKRYLARPATRESILAAQVALRSIPISAAEYKEAQKLLARCEIDLNAAEAQAKQEEIKKLRDKLQVDYQTLLSDANPHLNYITTRLDKHKDGFVLWGVHTYFSQYTFSIGGDAKVVSAWIQRNQGDLKRAGILRVGVKSSESWGGSCWFEV